MKGVGSLDAEIKYSSGEAGLSCTITNHTDYEVRLGDPMILYKKTVGEMYEALYLSAYVQGGSVSTIAGSEIALSPGESRRIDILPFQWKMTGGITG